jgi:GNAT superfamily N-acetyltransferase
MVLPNFIKMFFSIFGISFHNTYYIKKNLNEPITTINSLIPLDIKEANDEEISRLVAKCSPYRQKFVNSYIENNSTCLIAMNNGVIAGCIWFNDKPNDFLGLKFEKPIKGVANGYGGYVFREFRGKKVFEALIEAQYKIAKEQGFDYLANAADKKNIASVKARQKFNPVMTKYLMVVFPFKKYLIFNNPYKVKQDG